MKPSARTPRLCFGTTLRKCGFPRNHWVRRVVSPCSSRGRITFSQNLPNSVSAICTYAIWDKYYPQVGKNNNFILNSPILKNLYYTLWKAVVCRSGFSLQRAYLTSCRMLHTEEPFPKSSDNCWNLIRERFCYFSVQSTLFHHLSFEAICMVRT